MHQQESSTTSQSIPNEIRDATLNLENLLIEEYKYAGSTAYQAIEDRARIVNLYYILLGILATGLSAIYQFSGSSRPYSQLLVILLLLVVSGLSVTFFINVIRLRQSFLESIIAMNVIKEFYIQQFQQQMPNIEKVFRWRLKTIPTGERIGSVTFIMGYLIALVGSLCLAIVAALTVNLLLHDPNFTSIISLIAAIITFPLALFIYTLYYRHSLSHRSAGALQLEQIKELTKDLA
jgi:hypothetical protein